MSRACVAAACALALISTAVRAEIVALPQAEEAKRHFEIGVAAISASKWAEAITALEKARAVYPTAPIHFNLGLAYRGAGRVRDAIASFERYRRAVGESGDSQRNAEVTRYLTTLRASLAQVQLDVTPADAEIFLDGRSTSRAALLELDPGTHTLAASAEGYARILQQLTLPPGSTVPVVLRLEPLKRKGRLSVATSVNTSIIRIDGVSHSGSAVDAEVAPGTHVVEIEAAGYEKVRREVQVVHQGRAEVTVALKRKRSPAGWVVLGIVAAAAVGAGVGIGVVYGSKDAPPLVPQLGVVTTGLTVRAW